MKTSKNLLYMYQTIFSEKILVMKWSSSIHIISLKMINLLSAMISTNGLISMEVFIRKKLTPTFFRENTSLKDSLIRNVK